MATQVKDEIDEMANAFGERFVKEINKQMADIQAKKYSGMEKGDIAIRIGDTIYETDVSTVLITGAVAGAVGYIGYKVVSSLL